MNTLSTSSFKFATSIASALLLCVDPGFTDPVRLPAGMSVPLELQHHINSGYTPVGSPVYFRVAHDVTIDGQTLIAGGTLVTGHMERAAERRMLGKSGSMSVVVEAIRAVDGAVVRVDADLDKQGRSRAGATVAWTLFWGLPGLVTRGVNPYMEKGAELIAIIRDDATIDPANALPDAARPEPGLAAKITQHRWNNDRANTEKKFDIERKTTMKPVSFTVELPEGISDPVGSLASLQLLEVDGVPVPEETRATASASDRATFDGWAIARYCRDGENTLTIGGVDPDGRRFHATHVMRFKIRKKG